MEKNGDRPIKTIPIPVGAFKVLLRPKKPITEDTHRKLVEAFNVPATIVVVPTDTEVIVISRDGQTKVY